MNEFCVPLSRFREKELIVDFSSVPGVTGTMEVAAIAEAAGDTEDTEGASQGTR